ncbi:MAG: hypothetical protein AAFR59_08035 [Bacteroidota bacterium]
MNKNIVVLIIVSLSLLWSCNKTPCVDGNDPSCPNYNPCGEAQAIELDFTISEVLEGEISATFATDTAVISGRGGVRFEAVEGYKSYRWAIGSDTREFTDRVVQLGFREREFGLPIRLYAERYAWQIDTCGGKKGRKMDTLIKPLTVLPPSENAMIGRYKGRVEGGQDTDTLTVSIDWIVADPLLPGFLTISNVPRGCKDETPYGSNLRINHGYTGMVFSTGGWNGCGQVKGTAYVNDTRDSLTVAYTLIGDRKDTLVFRGRRME